MKVLYFIPGTGVGGIGQFVKDVVSHMPSDVEFTFVTLGDGKSDLSAFLEAHGKVLNYPRWGREVIKGLKKELKETKYDIVHAHAGCWSFISLFYAKLAGVKRRIAHSHSADNFRTMNGTGKAVYCLSKPLNPFVVTDYIACSDHACEETFGKNVVRSGRYHRVLNPVDGKFFEEASHDVREELGISKDSRIVCHVGYMGYHKNHTFILRLAEELKDNDLYWLLVGDGYSRTKYETAAKEKGLDKVLFLGTRNDVPDVLKASDVFILPSLLEGLGTVVLEAQACGVRCVVSENVTDETDMGLGLVRKIPLDDIREWERDILSGGTETVEQEDIKQIFVSKNVEVNACAKVIYELYNQQSR